MNTFLSARRYLIACLLLATLVAGCKSKGPRFDPRQSRLEPAGAEARLFTSKLERLSERAFSSIYSTNAIAKDWLTPPHDFFKLGPGDVIEIEMLGTATSRGSALVGPDGKIYYSLLPGVFVWGLSLAETKALLEKELARYIKLQPEVAVNLRYAGSKKVWILGSVSLPGVYSLATPLTLLEAISTAGGVVEEQSDLRNSFVMRQGELLRIDFYQLFRKGDLSQNIYLQPDDFIYLRSSGGKAVYVLGAVPAPNMYEFLGQMSLMSALSRAGGTVPYAQLSQVAIVRGSLSQPAIAEVNGKAIMLGKAPDVRLEPGDIVYVPFKPYRQLALLGDQILRQFISTLALNEGYRAVIEGASPVGVSIGSGGIGGYGGGGLPGYGGISTPLPWR